MTQDELMVLTDDAMVDALDLLEAEEVPIGELLDDLRVAKEALLPALAEVKIMEAEVKRRVLASGEAVHVPGASATIRAGYSRARWDSKALDTYLLLHERSPIRKFRSESQVAPGVTIKLR